MLKIILSMSDYCLFSSSSSYYELEWSEVKSKIISQNWIILDVRVGVVDSFKHEPYPFNVKTDFRENSVLVRVAKECRLPSGAETDDS